MTASSREAPSTAAQAVTQTQKLTKENDVKNFIAA
jgi:hypothetical protein